MSRDSDFRSTAVSLWFRLITLGIVALVFSEGLYLVTGRADGWMFYLTPSEVAFEAAVRLVFAALAGIAVGSICLLVLAPALWYFKSDRERLADWATKIAVVLVLFFVFQYALNELIKWSYNLRAHAKIVDLAVLAAFYVGFAVALCIPRARKEVVTGMDGFLSEKMTRRTAVATVVGTAAVVATEFALSRRLPSRAATLSTQRPKSNFLLITFDALSAEDMSLYGYKLPTTPNIEAFARRATVFTNFYSVCTFTTPSIAAISTGLYPSESAVYQLQGRLRPDDASKSLPHLMQSAGYATGGFMSNPFAYYLSKRRATDFDDYPAPVFHKLTQPLWDAISPLHQDSGFGSRIDEYLDLEHLWAGIVRLPHNMWIRYRPVASFEHARQVLSELPDGYFLWLHVLAPHDPYIPDSADKERFIPDIERGTFEGEPRRWQPYYAPDQQSQVDRRRLAYDEYVASADRAFGAFMSGLENSDKLRNTTVVVAADHGESFEGGVYRHQNPYLTRPVIHVPLIIRTPGQQEGQTINVAADQTSLAPTILELAGLPKPDSMRGHSLVAWLNRGDGGQGEGLAFSQYFEKNSIFKPLRHGTVGVIDGQYQYVFYLDSQKGELRPLNEAQIWNLDRSAEFPAQTAALRAALHSRFPDLVPNIS